MKIYLAGTSVSDPIEEIKMQKLFKKSGHKLHSFFHKDRFEKKWLQITMKNKIDLFLDSGAFSAWTQNTEINIDEYISFIKENQEFITVYANLDVIGDPKATWENQKKMERAGLYPIPCFHYGEDVKWLKKYLDGRYSYLAMGGLVGKSFNTLVPWLDYLFLNFLCDEEGFPRIKIHGFGLTSLPLMFRYPWYSVDSTSWVITGRMGGFFMPVKKNGQWCYKTSWKISVSNKSPNQKEFNHHYKTMSPLNQKIVEEYLEMKGYCIGRSDYKMEPQSYKLKDGEKWAEKKPKDTHSKRKVEIIIEPGISNTYQLRDELNIIYYIDLEKHFPKWPWALKLNSTSLL